MSTENQTTGNVNLKKQDLSQLVNICIIHVTHSALLHTFYSCLIKYDLVSMVCK